MLNYVTARLSYGDVHHIIYRKCEPGLNLAAILM